MSKNYVKKRHWPLFLCNTLRSPQPHRNMQETESNDYENRREKKGGRKGGGVDELFRETQ